MKSKRCDIFIFILFIRYLGIANCFPEQGKWSYTINGKTQQYFGISKSLYKNSLISIKVACDSTLKLPDPLFVKIGWLVRQTRCYEDYVGAEIFKEDYLHVYYTCPETSYNTIHPEVRIIPQQEITTECTHTIHLMPYTGNFTILTEENNSQTPLCKGNVPYVDENIPSVDSKNNIKTDSSNQDNQKKDGQTSKIIQRLVRREVKDTSESNDNSVSVSKTKAPKTVKENEDLKNTIPSNKEKENASTKLETVTQSIPKSNNYQVKIDMDGMYLLVILIESVSTDREFNVTVDVAMKYDYGYLSAVDWPLLPFYGVMCGIYVIYAVGWLIVTALQWRDLLRIQFWIGGVILLGLIEKAVLYAEYQSLNESGESVKGAIIFAELLSSLKRTLARMLVIIVSLGFGIVKPRLGPLLHRVVGVGALYFILSAIEGCLRSLKMKNDPSNQTLIAGVPLAVMDSAICWWIFSSLVQTTRTLQLRRNLVKLSLYKHFTNTLIFAVIASIAYMIWSIHSHKFTSCITDWKELWVDEAYWHFLFSIILLVIMILWRPTNNNQRYAFTPLLDAEDDDDEEDETKENTINNDAFGMKMRGKGQSNTPTQKDNRDKEDDLKWAEENIPSLPESALPSLLDSDEEIMTAKFERNKME